MKKLLLSTAGFLLLCLLVAGGFLWVYRAPLLSDYLSQKLEMEVRIGHLSLSSQGIVIEEMTLYDPSLKIDVAAHSITVDTPLTSLFSNPLAIRTLTIDSPSIKTDLLNFNPKKLESWFKLPNLVKKVSPQKSEKKTSFTFIIHQFSAENIHVDLGTTTLDVPSIHLTSINSLKPLSLDHLLTLVITTIATKPN